ncbi:extracellular solute-binding protein [Clostridium sp. CM028]|uniref:ABC transporter substrate-binding protein n=1 Tax=unclassified Clostridium TaxID=2614128 RepID=UPI001C0AC6EF|nr:MULTISPECIES: extracellular solute-binding protein [unclassified Clostridium]MBU3093006.1 extracellular solute-binding protein [Clostridium sp. CF011]MBW9149179.1 extracellular solute-binding protein [Clostridium sp. CM028]WAG70951.1 extracellular solute-binding protein [Clostridium sp. CF011]WLC62563.1 extracellular solute-binding protein [Clostridium sp. CM028]
MKKSKKLFCLLMTTAVLTSALAGCGSKNSATSTTVAEETEVTIRVETTFTGADPYTEVWQQAIKDFQAKNPKIKVIDEATSAASEAFKTKINTDFASGNEPDVTYGFNSASGKPLVDSGKVISWEDELAKDATWAANFKKSGLDAAKYNGKLYALPYIGFFEGVWINTDLFKNNGLEIPKTYEDIIKAIPVLNAKNITPIACSFAEEPHYLIETLLLSQGGASGHSKLFDASWAPALALTKDLYDKKAFTKDALTIKQAACSQAFADKKAAMFISGSWAGGAFQGMENVSVIPFPLVPGAKANANDIIGGTGTGWYVTKALNDKKNGAGIKFVKFMTEPEQLAKFAEKGGVPLENVPSSTTGGALAKNIGDFTTKATSMTGPAGDNMNQEAFTAIWKGMQYIASGKKTSQQVLDEAQKLVK